MKIKLTPTQENDLAICRDMTCEECPHNNDDEDCVLDKIILEEVKILEGG